MSSFDAYHKWLGIPPEQQPPSYYRLLAIPLLEADADVIETAAEQRTLLLRTFQTGPNSELAERLLNEVSAARVCLLDGKSKARYDTQLRVMLQPAPAEDPLRFTTEELAAVSSRASTRQRSRGAKPVWKEPWAIPAAAGGIVVVLLLLMMLFGSGEEPKNPGNKSTNTTQDSQQKTQPTASKETLPAKAATPPLAVAPFDAAEAKAHQQAWSKYLGVPVEYTNSIGMKFMLIPPGSLTMIVGSEAHRVPLTKTFYLGVYEVTQEQYKRVMDTNPSIFNRPNCPVENVSCDDAVRFCRKLSELLEEKGTGYVCRLPTEAEWEYACRAGTTTKYFFGDSDAQLGNYGWYNKNSGKTRRSVRPGPLPGGEKKPNPWGLYDTHGNVWEWCSDSHSNYSSETVTNPTAAESGLRRVRRGGSWNDSSDLCRASKRRTSTSSYRYRNLGFRVALEIPVRAQPNTIAAETKSLPASLQQGLIAYYPFNGNAKDESGNGHHGVIYGARLVSDRFDRTDQSFEFDGNSHIKLQSPIAPSSDLSFTIWFRKNSLRSYLPIVSWPFKDNQTGLKIQLQGNELIAGHHLSPFCEIHIANASNAWHHVAFSGEGNSFRLYLNGKAGASKSHSPRKAGVKYLLIGSEFESFQKTHRSFQGSLDDVRIYNRALSEAEVKALYEFEKP